MFSNLEQLFWYRLVFLLELLIAEFLFCKNLKRRSYFILRLFLSFLLFFRDLSEIVLKFYGMHSNTAI